MAAEIEAERKERDGVSPKEAVVELYRRAGHLYLDAARKGHVDAAVALARLHERGAALTAPHTLATLNPNQAARWYQVLL